jgi:hypothetical protein
VYEGAASACTAVLSTDGQAVVEVTTDFTGLVRECGESPTFSRADSRPRGRPMEVIE